MQAGLPHADAPHFPASPAREHLPLWVCRVLAGLDAGVFASLFAFASFVVHSRFAGEFWWSKFNLAAAPFFGDRVFSVGFGIASLTGIALLLLNYAVLGALIAFATPGAERWYRCLLTGLAGALSFHLVAERLMWPLLHPFGTVYFPRLATLPAHLAFGFALVRIAARYRSFALTFADIDLLPPPPPPPPPPLVPLDLTTTEPPVFEGAEPSAPASAPLAHPVPDPPTPAPEPEPAGNPHPPIVAPPSDPLK